MDTKAQVVPDRYDSLDAERFREMITSPPFLAFTRRVVSELDRARNDCAGKTELPQIFRAQGSAAALLVVLALPETMAREMDAGRKKKEE